MKLPLVERAADVAALAECVKALSLCTIKHPHGMHAHASMHTHTSHACITSMHAGDAYRRIYSPQEVAFLAHVAHHLWEPMRIHKFTQELVCKGREAHEVAVKNLLLLRGPPGLCTLVLV